MLVQTQQLQAEGLSFAPMHLLSLFPLGPFSRKLLFHLHVCMYACAPFPPPLIRTQMRSKWAEGATPARVRSRKSQGSTGRMTGDG